MLGITGNRDGRIYLLNNFLPFLIMDRLMKIFLIFYAIAIIAISVYLHNKYQRTDEAIQKQIEDSQNIILPSGGEYDKWLWGSNF